MKFLEENLLEHLQRPEFQQLRQAFTSRALGKNDFLCTPDTSENKVFIVKSGRARVYLGYEEKEFNLAILAPGDIYSTHTGVFVQAIEALQVLTTDIRTFRRQMSSDGEVNRAMIKVLGGILKSSFAIIDGLVFKDVSCRLLSLLLTEAKRVSPAQDGSITLQIDLSMEDLARMVGSSRQTISTLINQWVRKDILRKQGRGIFLVPDIDRLAQTFTAADC